MERTSAPEKIGVFLIVAFGILIFLSDDCHAAIDRDICSSRESLCRALEDNGFTKEEMTSVFTDERVTLYPEILEKRGKGLNYFSKKFGLLTRKSVERGRRILKENRTLLASVGRSVQSSA